MASSRVFVDTDICIDLLSGRQPFNGVAEIIFSKADKGTLNLCVCSLSFANIDYILRSQYKKDDSRKILAKFKTLVKVMAVTDKIIDLAIASDFTDFEDAIQYHTAAENGIDIFLTRNLKDYKKAQIQVISPETFLATLE